MKHIKKFEAQSENKLDMEYIETCFISIVEDYGMTFSEVTTHMTKQNEFYEECWAIVEMPIAKVNTYNDEFISIQDCISLSKQATEIYMDIDEAINRVKLKNIQCGLQRSADLISNSYKVYLIFTNKK